MTGQKKLASMQNMVNGLYELGYIDERDKAELLYRLDTGDYTACWEIRDYLIKVADEIVK